MGEQRMRQQVRGAMVLAGGDGSRLAAFTRRLTGYSVPKQFCAVIGEETLIEQTWKRVSLSVRPEHTITVVSRAHEKFYERWAAQRSLVVQPENRGTAPAILYGLLRLGRHARTGPVAILPSDHYLSDDRKFMQHVDAAFAAVERRRDLVVLLGITPNSPEVQYGWIESDASLANAACPLMRIRRFWEKPTKDIANLLWKKGCLWNSFVIVAQITTLLDLFLKALPRLYVSFSEISTTLETAFEVRSIQALYDKCATLSFSDRVLQRFPSDLTVLPVGGVEWNDLGEPDRVMATLERVGLRPEWARAG